MQVTAHATRTEGWWAVEVPDIDGLITQTRRLDQIDAAVRDAAELLGVDPDSLEVAVTTAVPHGDDARAARELADTARAQQEQARTAMRTAARLLVDDGLPVRDVGHLLGVSFQQAQKLATPAKAG